MTYLRTAVWGPAEFVGPPPARLVGKGVLVGAVAASAILGTALLGAWTGVTALARGEAGLAVVAALAVYLVSVGAGRALVGVTALLGVCFALQAPQAAAGMVLAERGQVRSVMVTSVEAARMAGGGDGHYLCAVTNRDGVPLGIRIWRGCDGSIRPGDTIDVVYDPRERVPPRGATGGPGPWRGPARWGAALLAAGATAVVRSYRLPAQSGTV
ncbi:hypothetical protein [Streptomyces malaysiense]|uniref:Uncharacterized protein n=1 Tax=Streptomyces malaysiense TaxID=1428626 RepID=A0A1J4Q8K7_9ACTN|nr:hypothetical protein [Streptomyces malaysiense]OIK28416.1 hypothetical protein VT52_007150 [Streptomyces malaysiense]